MPRYDYYCHGCKSSFILSHSWKETREQCPKCNKRMLEKQISKARINKTPDAPEGNSEHRVHEAIRGAKKDLKNEKITLRKRTK